MALQIFFLFTSVFEFSLDTYWYISAFKNAMKAYGVEGGVGEHTLHKHIAMEFYLFISAAAWRLNQVPRVPFHLANRFKASSRSCYYYRKDICNI